MPSAQERAATKGPLGVDGCSHVDQRELPCRDCCVRELQGRGKTSVGEFSADKKIHEFRDRKKAHVAGFRLIPGRFKFFRCVGRDYKMFTSGRVRSPPL